MGFHKLNDNISSKETEFVAKNLKLCWNHVDIKLIPMYKQMKTERIKSSEDC